MYGAAPISALPISAAPQVTVSAVSGGGGGANLGYPYGINWWRRKKRRRPPTLRESYAEENIDQGIGRSVVRPQATDTAFGAASVGPGYLL